MMLAAAPLLALAMKHTKDVVLAAILGLAVVCGLAARHYRADAVAADARAHAATVQAQTYRDDAAKDDAALLLAQNSAVQQAAADNSLEDAINAAKTSTGCARSPALRALLERLHQQPGHS